MRTFQNAGGGLLRNMLSVSTRDRVLKMFGSSAASISESSASESATESAFFFSDSEVAIGALKKGRSSSRGVNFYCRRICAEIVVRNVTLCLRHVAGKQNVADAPSRGMSWPGVLTN